jgi:hypothetical protein
MQATFIITVLHEPAERELAFDVGPPARRAIRPDPAVRVSPIALGRRGVEQEAGAIGQDVTMLAGDLIVANPAPASRSLESDSRGVDGGQKRVEVRAVARAIFPLVCFPCASQKWMRRGRDVNYLAISTLALRHGDRLPTIPNYRH